jgi:hypothetical protein
MGAEADIIDEGPESGTEPFIKQEAAGLAIIASLDEATRGQVLVTADVACSSFRPF